MPIFAYRCESCGFEKDVLQKRSDPPLESCPSCGKDAFRKQISAPAFQLKGSGWYVTDFRDGGKNKDKAGGKGEDKGKGEDRSDAPKPASEGGASAGADTAAAKPAPAAPAPAAAPSTPASGSKAA